MSIIGDYFTRRRLLAGVAATGMTGLIPVKSATADLQPPESFPSKPIEFIVGFGAGGAMDVAARITARYFEKHTGRTVVVVNKGGAAGAIADQYLVKSAPADGSVIGILAYLTWENTFLKANGKWSYKEARPVAFLNSDPSAWIISQEGPYRGYDFSRLIAVGRDQPNKLNIGANPATASGFLADQIEIVTGARYNHVPYQGGKQMITDLLGGHIDISHGYFSEYGSLRDAGRISVVGIAADKRSPFLPTVPTFNELLGRTDVLWDAFRFAAVPRGVPESHFRWLVKVFDRILEDPGIKADFEAQGTTLDRSLNTPERLEREVDKRAELDRSFLIRSGRLK